LGAETVIVVDPDPATLDGLKEAVGPFGEAVMLKLTVPVKPPEGVMVIVY
jgi:hypothetical protein